MINLFAAQPMQPHLCPMLRGDVAGTSIEEPVHPMTPPESEPGEDANANGGGDVVSGEGTATSTPLTCGGNDARVCG